MLALTAGCLYVLAGAPYLTDFTGTSSLLIAPLVGPLIISVSVACGMLAASSSAWRWLQFPIVLIHELGHATAAVLLGGRARRIVLVKDGSGHAVYQLPDNFRVLRRVPASLAGYWAPSFVACTAAVAAGNGLSRALVWLCAFATSGMLILLVRSRWGALVAGGVLLGSAGAARLLPGTAITLVVAFCAGVLAVGSVRSAYVQIDVDDITNSDAASIARELHLPARGIAWVQLLGCAMAALFVVITVSR